MNKEGKMKKVFAAIIILIVLCMAVCFCACQKNYSKEGEIYTLLGAYDIGLLSKDDLSSIAKKLNEDDCSPQKLNLIVKNKILKTLRYDFITEMEKFGFEDYEVPDYEIAAYYGEYDGFYAVSIHIKGEKYEETPIVETIDGVQFEFAKGYEISVFVKNEDIKDYEPKEKGDFYTLTDAYEKGLLGIEDIKNIAYYQNTSIGIDYAIEEGLIEEDFVPSPITPQELSYAQEFALRETKAYLRRHAQVMARENASPDDFSIIRYYGIYNDCIVVMMHEEGTMYTEAVWQEIIDGVIIDYSNGNRIYVWQAKQTN